MIGASEERMAGDLASAGLAVGTIMTVVGAGNTELEENPASAALSYPEGLAVDELGNVYVTDSGNSRVRRVSPDGLITTVVGTGELGASGDNGPAVRARLGFPEGLAIDRFGNLYISDCDNHCVRRVSPDGMITTVGGTAGAAGSGGDGGPATEARLSYPDGLAVDSTGNLYIADRGNRRVRRVLPDGVMTTVAGTGEFGSAGDGGPATEARLSYPGGLAVDGLGNVYVSDCDNCRVRRVSPGGVITTVAGTGEAADCSGDGGPAAEARLAYRDGLAVDQAGNLYIADRANNRVRMVRAVESVEQFGLCTERTH